jgi:hypothetical protein
MPSAHASKSLDDHIIVCGCGRVGRLVACVLEAAKMPYLAIEADLARFGEPPLGIAGRKPPQEKIARVGQRENLGIVRSPARDRAFRSTSRGAAGAT